MPQLSKLLIDQKNIFLAPGDYFHSEFVDEHYHQLPVPLQQLQNLQLIEQYQLDLPDEKTLILPEILAENWSLLPSGRGVWGLFSTQALCLGGESYLNIDNCIRNLATLHGKT